MENIKKIWSNFNVNTDEWKRDYMDLYETREDEDFPEDELWDFILDSLQLYLDDEKMNLDIETKGRIICVADIGRWDGRYKGYKLLGNNINECLEFMSDCEYAEWYVQDGEFKSTQAHHDGYNYVWYRELRSDIVDDYDLEIAMENCSSYEEFIYEYTTSLGGYVNKVYGW